MDIFVNTNVKDVSIFIENVLPSMNVCPNVIKQVLYYLDEIKPKCLTFSSWMARTGLFTKPCFEYVLKVTLYVARTA